MTTYILTSEASNDKGGIIIGAIIFIAVIGVALALAMRGD